MKSWGNQKFNTNTLKAVKIVLFIMYNSRVNFRKFNLFKLASIGAAIMAYRAKK